MKRTWMTLLIAAACIGAGEAYWLQRREVLALRAERAAHEAELTALTKKLAALERRAQEADRAARAVRREVAPRPVGAAQGREPEAPVLVKAASAAPAAPAADLASMLKNPSMKEMVRAQQKGQLDVTYGALFKCLPLSEADHAAFKTLLLDRQMALVDDSMAMMGAGVSAEEKKAAGERIKETMAAYDRQVKELLGDENYRVFKAYEETQAERMQVSMFKGTLGETVQLSDEQEDSLIRAMHEARSAFKPSSGGDGQSPDASQFTPEGIERILADGAKLQELYAAKAAEILTPAQLELFKANQKQQRAMQEMGMRMAAKMFGQGPSDASAGKK